MDDKRNLFLAVVLSALILIGWTVLAERFLPTPPPPAKSATTATGISAAAPGAPVPNADPAAAPATARAAPVALNQALTGPRVAIDTPRVKGSINLTGARIDDLTLTQYRTSTDKNAPAIRLLSPGGTKAAYFTGVGWTGPQAPGPRAVWTADAARLTPTTPVTLSWDNGVGQTYRIKYAIDADYMITATQSVANTGAGAVSVASYAYVNRATKPTDPHEVDSYTIHVGPMGVFDGKADYDVDYKSLDAGESLRRTSTGGWIGFTDKYWLAAVIPAAADRVTAEMRAANGLYQTNFTRGAVVLEPGKAVTQTTRLFTGAKETPLLDRYEKDLGIAGFDRATDWGWFYWFAKPIFYLLHWLFGVLGNFGFAIMALTLIIRTLMFPIAQKQFTSMAQMRIVQPKMKALQDKYKDDKPRLQQEMLKLYQTEKINPAAGCLPVLVQIPIFYALYKVLMLSVEMRHQPFILWIKDLSAPDPAKILNLFGLLPFDPPSLLGIGVLAVLLGVTMWLQFRLNPAPADPIQAQVFAIMPWMLMFVMAPFAAGLLVYWITNNVLTMAQQQWLYSRYPEMKAAAATPPVKAK